MCGMEIIDHRKKCLQEKNWKKLSLQMKTQSRNLISSSSSFWLLALKKFHDAIVFEVET